MTHDIVITVRPGVPDPGTQGRIKIDLDDRSFLMPIGKPLNHLLIYQTATQSICFDAVFAFNNSRDSNNIATLTLTETRAFAAELLAAVYSAKTRTAILDTINITINVLVNGYQMDFVRHDSRLSLYVGTGPIWRLIKGILEVTDALTPSTSN